MLREVMSQALPPSFGMQLPNAIGKTRKRALWVLLDLVLVTEA